MKSIKHLAILVSVLVFIGALVSLNAQEAMVSVSISELNIQQGGSAEIAVTFVYPEDMHQTLQEDFFYIDIEEKPGFSLGETVYPEGEVDEFGVIHYYDQTTLKAPLYIDSSVKTGSHNITVYAGYQLCFDSGTCTMPEEVENELTIEVTPGVVEAAGDGNIWLYLLLALLGGLVLNFTPCVFPVLSLRAFTLIRDSQDDRKKIAVSSLIYSAGVVVSFLILAGIIAVLKASGEMIGWGFQFQNPTFVFVLTAIMFAFALSLFDVFVISAPESQTASKMSNKGGLLGSFFMGIFAVLLGTPCTAPMLGAALAFAFAQPAAMIFAMFFLIGIGMALPFLLLAIKPQVVNKFPKPGEWMNTLKFLMGFLLLFWAIKQLNVLYYQIGGAALISVLYFLLALAFGIWLIGKYAKPYEPIHKKIIAIAIALIVVISVGFNTLHFDTLSENGEVGANTLEGRWQVFSPEKVEELRQQNIPVFIDFTAKWCTTCQTNEMTVLKTKDIQSAFEEAGVEIFIADFTNNDKVIATEIRKYGRAGVPVYVFYLPGEEEPVLLPEMINKKMVLDVLDRIK
ncbi:MAG: thioredoxin family protein, partial [Candidatus Cloacimonas sp.]|nr:thioredoxin family protein [Candidatus Cloacimonadota bacterium]